MSLIDDIINLVGEQEMSIDYLFATLSRKYNGQLNEKELDAAIVNSIYYRLEDGIVRKKPYQDMPPDMGKTDKQTLIDRYCDAQPVKMPKDSRK